MLRLEAPRSTNLMLDEGSLTSDPFYNFAIGMTKEAGVQFGQAKTLLDSLPYASEMHPRELPTVLTRIEAATYALPLVEKYVADYMLEHDPLDIYSFFDDLISNESHPKNLGLSSRAFRIAIANIAFINAASIFKECDEQEKQRNYKPLAYFGVIHDLIIGSKTNITMFLEDPNAFDISFVSTILPVMKTKDNEAVREEAAKHIFNGGGVSELIQSAGQESVVLYFD